MKFKVYVDYTTEETPRPFYVGKGNESRVSSFDRNNLHTSISNKYGIQRKIVFETDNEQEAFAQEKHFIFELKTFVGHGWGSNFTLGGEGSSGLIPSDESLRKNSESNTGEKNGMFGKHHSPETRKKIGDNQRGWKHTDEAKQKQREASKRLSLGRKWSQESKEKMSKSCMGRTAWNKGKKFGPRKTKRVFSEQARKNMSEARKGKIPWNKGLGKEKPVAITEQDHVMSEPAEQNSLRAYVVSCIDN